MPDFPDCLFCRIVSGEIPAKIVGENDQARAFLDINPAAPGHTLVVPRRHAATILEMDEASVLGVFRLVKELLPRIRERLKAEGFTIGVNHGKIAGQGVDHFHVHVIPRFSADGGGSLHTVVEKPQTTDLDEIYRKITS